MAVSALTAENAELRVELGRLQRLTRTDPLTGLANRRGWNDQISNEFSRALRSRRPLCLGLIDLDQFKAFNDVHGHQAGDRLLIEIAAAWRSQVREIDLLCRWGGDEFALLLPDCPLTRATEVVSRLQASIPGGQAGTGAAGCWDRLEPVSALLARVDQGLYEAKSRRATPGLADTPARPTAAR